MTSGDRFGFKGEPEIQRARRLQPGGAPMPAWAGPILAPILGMASAYLFLMAYHWPGRVSGALGVVTALLGFLA